MAKPAAVKKTLGQHIGARIGKASGWLPAVAAFLCLCLFAGAAITLFDVNSVPKTGQKANATGLSAQGTAGLRRLLEARGHEVIVNRMEDGPLIEHGDLEIITLDDDGGTLTYAYHFDSDDTSSASSTSVSSAVASSAEVDSESAASASASASGDADEETGSATLIPDPRRSKHVLRQPLGKVVLGQGGAQLGGALTSLLDPILGKLTGIDLSQGIPINNYGVIAGLSTSAYFQGTYKILDSLDFTLGIRGQHEDRALIHSHTALATADGEITLISSKPPGLESDRLSPRVALEWHPFDDSGSQIYASWSRAYKSPTYNTVNLLGGLPNVLKGGPDEIKPLRSEKVTTAEVGAKTDWFDGALRLDVAAFYTWQKDLLTGFVALESGGVVSYENAPAAKIEGAEMDFVWTPLPEWDPGLAITGAASYLDGRYTDYPQGRGFDTTTGLAFGSDGTEVLPARNFDGNRIVRTPNFTGNLGVNQSIPIGENSRIELAADTNYSSGFFFLPQDSSLYARNPYNVVNARVSYFYEPAKVQLTAFVQNLGNISYNEGVFVDDFGRNQVLNAPRTFGGRVKWSF